MSSDSQIQCRACGAVWAARFEATGLPPRVICPVCQHQDAVSIDGANGDVLYLNPLGSGTLPRRTAEIVSPPVGDPTPPRRRMISRDTVALVAGGVAAAASIPLLRALGGGPTELRILPVVAGLLTWSTVKYATPKRKQRTRRHRVAVLSLLLLAAGVGAWWVARSLRAGDRRPADEAHETMQARDTSLLGSAGATHRQPSDHRRTGPQRHAFRNDDERLRTPTRR